MWHLGQGDTKPFEWPCKLLKYQTACLNMCFKLWHQKVYFAAFWQSLCHASYKTKSVWFYNYALWTRWTSSWIYMIYWHILIFATSISFKKNIRCVCVSILPNPLHKFIQEGHWTKVNSSGIVETCTIFDIWNDCKVHDLHLIKMYNKKLLLAKYIRHGPRYW